MGILEDQFRQKANRGPGQIPALWTGTVTDVRSDGRVRVRIPRLGSNMSLGPMVTYVAGVAVGDPVICGAMAGNYADLAVLAFADSRVPLSGATGRALLAAATAAAARLVLVLDQVNNTSDLNKPISTATAAALAGKSDTSHTHTYAAITGKPATFAPTIGTTATTAKAGNWVPAWTEVTSKPTTFAPIVGTGAADAKAGNWVPAWTDVTAKPATFPPSAHTHLWADLTDKPSTFAPSAHTHLWADLTDKPATFPPSAHTHAGADVAAATTTTPGTMSAADKAKLDAAATAPTISTLVVRDLAGRAQFENPVTAKDAATKGYVDQNIHRRSEYTTTGFGVNANEIWDIGPLVAVTGTGKAVGAAFATPHATLSGALIINETGFYNIGAFVTPRTNPGNTWLRVALYNSNDTLAEVIVQAPNGAACWETSVGSPVPQYITSGQYVRFIYSASTAHTIDSKVRVWKVGSLSTWGL